MMISGRIISDWFNICSKVNHPQLKQSKTTNCCTRTSVHNMYIHVHCTRSNQLLNKQQSNVCTINSWKCWKSNVNLQYTSFTSIYPKKDKAQNLHEYILYAPITLIPILNEKQLTLPRGVNETKILSLLKKILQTFIPTN